MADKRETKASCPGFQARVDQGDQHWIECRMARFAYLDKDERDADYRTACCGDHSKCPIWRVTQGGIVHPVLGYDGKPWHMPTTEKYPTIEDMIVEERKNERKRIEQEIIRRIHGTIEHYAGGAAGRDRVQDP